ncbi:MAG: hypothetical protein ACRDLT_11640 [Solirubrobacteraceae bacterium]
MILPLASDSSGAELGTRHFSLRVGEFAEARIRFAGSGETIYNWPAWWLSGPEPETNAAHARSRQAGHDRLGRRMVVDFVRAWAPA